MASLRDCVYGEAVGDALGVPYEGCLRDTFECRDMVGGGAHGKAAGTFSDDTSMALALCDSYRACGRIDCADARERFCRWYKQGAYTTDGLFGMGRTTYIALERGLGCAGEYDNGNGSLMRTMPLAFTPATDEEVRAVSAITHAHATSTQACVDAVHCAQALIAGAGPREAAASIGYAGVECTARDDIRSSAYVLDTLKAALWCLTTTESYEACVRAAVNLGGDSDTTAAVAGALAGIVYGIEGIPQAWMDTLRGKELIEACLF